MIFVFTFDEYSYKKNGKMINTEYMPIKDNKYEISTQFFIDEPGIGSYVNNIAEYDESIKTVIDCDEYFSLSVLEDILKSDYKFAIGKNQVKIESK